MTEPHPTLAPVEPPPVDTSLLAAVPGLARVAAAAGLRIAHWAVDTTTTATTEILRAVAAGESPAQAISEVASELRVVARGVLGVPEANGAGSNGSTAPSRDELRARGAALLQRSADVWFEEDTHPAYARILDDLTPDEARILRYLALEGPQPSIDVRTHRPFGVGSEVVASGLSMIGLQAGVRSLERTRADLNNLFRLGLVWFSREQVADPTRYQVVEVQPDVLEACKAAGRSPKFVHRSIHLTPFGEDFCAECLPLRTSAGLAPAPHRAGEPVDHGEQGVGGP